MTQVIVSPREKMQEKLQTIDAKLKAIKYVTGSEYKTNGKFKFNPVTQYEILIHRHTDLVGLLNILGFINTKHSEYEKAAEIAGLKKYPVFQWLGFNYDAWVNDLKIRIAQISVHEEITNLEIAKRELQKFLTEEDRLAMILKKYEDL